MLEYELIEQRIISGTGVMRITADMDYRDVIVYAQVVREPTNKFSNFKYSPPKSFYANITSLSNGSVFEESAMNYSTQIYRLTPDITKQVMVALKCIDDNVVNMLSLLSEAQFPGRFEFFEQLTEMTSLHPLIDEMVFNCYTNTAIALSQYGLKVVKCNPRRDDSPPPPPPPPPFDPVLPGSPLDTISPPYDEEDVFTAPFPDDDPDVPPEPEPEFPVGEECGRVLVSSAITTTTNGREVREEVVYGPVTDFYYNPSGGAAGNTRDAIILDCRGLYEFNGSIQPCQSPLSYVWQDASPQEFISAEILKVEPQT